MTAEFTHCFVPGAMSSAPTILALHGTGGDEHDLVPLARMIDGDSAILSPRGRVLEDGKPLTFRRLSEGVFDQEDLRQEMIALGQFLGEAAARYHFNRARIVALGYSKGANIAASLLLTEPNALAGAILLRPMVPFEPTSPPRLNAIPDPHPGGPQGPIVLSANTERLAVLLQESGASVTLLWQETGHALSPSDLERSLSGGESVSPVIGHRVQSGGLSSVAVIPAIRDGPRAGRGFQRFYGADGEWTKLSRWSPSFLGNSFSERPRRARAVRPRRRPGARCWSTRSTS